MWSILFEHYRRTGRFPEKTMLALALHKPRQKESISTDGYYEGDLTSLAVAVKDRDRFAGGWGYFSFGKRGRAIKS